MRKLLLFLILLILCYSLNAQKVITKNAEGKIIPSNTTNLNHIGKVKCVDTATGIWNRMGTVIMPSPTENGVQEPTLIKPEKSGLLLTGVSPVWKMWFCKGWTKGNIYYAESPDGINWTQAASPSVTNHYCPFIIKNGTTYYMYCANSTFTAIDEFTSTNGRDFSLAHDSVIKKTGRFGGWNYRSVANTGGIAIGDTLYLFVEGSSSYTLLIGDNRIPWSIGLYKSTDFHTFNEFNCNPVILSVYGGSRGGPSVPYYINGKWNLFVHGSTLDILPTDIYEYESPSLMGKWTRFPLNTVFQRETTDEGVDTTFGQVADPFLIEVNCKTYLYYSASSDGSKVSGNAHIKLAVADMPMSILIDTIETNDINKFRKSPGISVYPNPAKNNITIESPQQALIQITNNQGKPLKTFETTCNKTNVDVSGLTKGEYIVRVKTENVVKYKKFEKE